VRRFTRIIIERTLRLVTTITITTRPGIIGKGGQEVDQAPKEELKKISGKMFNIHEM
jgi:ribosomal protein S3